jgi:superfamily II DNA or RNA helicase
MVDEKVVPHMTLIIKIIGNEDILRSFLEEIKLNNYDRDEVSRLIRDNPCLELNIETSKRYVGSLCTYHFLNEENGKITLTEFSEDFLKGKLNYSDYILKCISLNLEWSYFLPDIQDIIEKSRGKISKAELLTSLEEKNYDLKSVKKESLDRSLTEILQALDLAKVITYHDAKISRGLRDRKEILYHAYFNQRELLKLLRLAERRVGKPTLRKIYRATVKSYIPLRKYRTTVSKIQEEIDEIRSIKIKKQREKHVKDFESLWVLKDDLYSWQHDFLDKWFENRKGIAEVVTGAGKTHLAMAIIEKLKKENDDLHVTIIVPTIVLLEQWFDNLVKKLRISPSEIGLRGGGHTDSFNDKKVLISVINSAIKDNFIGIQTKNIDNNLFIVDECHRAGAQEFRKIFNANRSYDLGLSATPEREKDNAYEEVLVKELGDKIGSYTYNDALEDDIIPRFDIYNYAVILNNEEKARYENLTREIHKIVERLKYKYSELNDPKVKMEIRLKQLQKKFPKDRDLFLYFQKTKERKDDVIYPASNRILFVKDILKRILEKKPDETDSSDSPLSKLSIDDTAIIFHEKIDEINSLFIELDSTDVSIYHSGFPNTLNRIGLDLFKSGQTRAILSVKALIEGVDVPNANVGIIMASSSSQIQRIQSLGRVLRRAEGKDETNLFIAYVKNTTDERIYKHAAKDWDKIIGKGNIEFRMWTEYGESEIDPPQPALKKQYVDLDYIDENTLEIGGIYPGKYEGEHYSFDSHGGIFRKTEEGRSYIQVDSKDLWNSFRRVKPGGGRFIVNRLGHALVKNKIEGKLETVYLGKYEALKAEEEEDI